MSYFITNAVARTAVAAAVKRILEASALYAQTEEDAEMRGDACRDILTCNDVLFGLAAYGTVSDDELEFIIERHDAMELWEPTEFAAKEAELRKFVTEGN